MFNILLELSPYLGGLLTIACITGVSHNSLRNRIKDIQLRSQDRVDEYSARSVISDNLRPVRAELQHIKIQMDNQQVTQKELCSKVDTIIEILHKK